MNEEEIVEILEDNIKGLKNLIPFRHTNEEKIQAIQGLLDLYKKEKEKNKELKTMYILATEYKKDTYISKDKIKEKIEELEKEQKEYKNSQEWEIQDDIVAQINILKDLLEEK